MSIYIQDGPRFTSSNAITAEAVDILNINVVKNTTSTPMEVDVQPGNLDEILFFYIDSDLYNDITYQFHDETGDGDEIILDNTHVITSKEIINLFEKSPKTIKFKNANIEKDAKITIAVARRASNGTIAVARRASNGTKTVARKAS